MNESDYAAHISKSPSLLCAGENYKVLCNSSYSLRIAVLTTYIEGILNIYICAGAFQLLGTESVISFFFPFSGHMIREKGRQCCVETQFMLPIITESSNH